MHRSLKQHEAVPLAESDAITAGKGVISRVGDREFLVNSHSIGGHRCMVAQCSCMCTA